MALTEVASAAIERLSAQWPFVLSALLVFAAAWFMQPLFKQDALSKFPLVGSEVGDDSKRITAFMHNAKEMYAQGYEKFKQGAFRITTNRGKQIPSRILSNAKHMGIINFSRLSRIPNGRAQHQISL